MNHKELLSAFDWTSPHFSTTLTVRCFPVQSCNIGSICFECSFSRYKEIKINIDLGYLPPCPHLWDRGLFSSCHLERHGSLDSCQMKFIRFWKEDILMRMHLLRCSLVAAFPSCCLAGFSRLFSAISTKPSLVRVSGCPTSLIQTFDCSDLFAHGIQYLFALTC